MTRSVGAALLAIACATPGVSSAQQAPNLTRQQRTALRALVTAVDAAATIPVPEPEWPIHLLRASDGSHYVAFSIIAPPGLRPGEPAMLYVRLATRRAQTAGLPPERSTVAEWLAGERQAPVRPQRALAFGDMPIFGAASAMSAGREPGALGRGVAPQTQQLLDMQRERDRERRETAERERRAALEGALRTPSTILPFEDFDLQAVAAADRSGVVVLRRSLTAGPGEYDLSVAWLDPRAQDPAAGVKVARRALTLPVASSVAFSLSPPIVADDVGLLETPVSSAQQTAHPYSIGSTIVTPARDHRLTPDERLNVFFQVMNAAATVEGKPEVTVGFRVFRKTTAGEDAIGVLNPHVYDHQTLPPDFDVRRGHPIFAAVGVPLRSFKRGTYRLQITADDRLAGVSTSTDAVFTVVATAEALLREAPPLGRPFRREAILSPLILEAIVERLRPRAPSAALSRALEATRTRRFIDLMPDDEISAAEGPTRTILRALALFALGDTTTTISASLTQLPAAAIASGPVQLLLGGIRALDGNDRDAVQLWEAASLSGMPKAALVTLVVDAYVRLGNAATAVDVVTRSGVTVSEHDSLVRRLAAALIASQREGDAVAALEPHLDQHPDDHEAQWLMLHALFSQFTRNEWASASHAAEQFRQQVAAYLEAGGAHAALAREWADLAR